MTSSSHIRRLALIGGIGGTILAAAASPAGAIPIDFRPEPKVDTPARPASTSIVDHCVGTWSLPQGQITAQRIVDRIRDVRPTKVVLTGGTGAYRTVRGEMLVWAPNAGRIEALTLRLIVD